MGDGDEISPFHTGRYFWEGGGVLGKYQLDIEVSLPAFICIFLTVIYAEFVGN